MAIIPRVVIRAGHFHFFHRLSAVVASKRGYFKNEGLLNWDLGATGEDEYTMVGIKAGKIHFGLDVKPELLLRENNAGSDVYIVGAFINGLPLVLIGAKGIKTVEDLKGKKFAATEKGGGIGGRQVKALLRKHGMEPGKDVTFVTGFQGMTAVDQVLASLDTGGFAARLTKRTHLAEVLEKGYPLLADFAEIYPEGYLQRAIVTTGAMIAQNPETIKAFLKGIIRGYRYMRNPGNFDSLIRLCKEVVWEKAYGWDVFDESWWETEFRHQFMLVPRDAMITKKGLEAYIEEEKCAGKLPGDCAMEQFVQLKFVEEASKEIDSRFGPDGYE